MINLFISKKFPIAATQCNNQAMDKIIYQDPFRKTKRMNEIYLDMTKGIAGDMFISAFFAFMTLQEREVFLELVSGLGNQIGLRPKIEEIHNRQLSGYRLIWETNEKERVKSIREASEIVSWCCSLLDVSDRSRRYAEKVLWDIVNAEAEAHRTRPENVHLHEIGRLVGLANIASAALCLDMLGLHDIPLIGSFISIGQGYVETTHGKLSVPTPASASLLKGMRFRFGPFNGEMATPTGIAIAKNAIRRQIDVLPKMDKECIGFGTRRFGNELGYVRILGADTEGQ